MKKLLFGILTSLVLSCDLQPSEPEAPPTPVVEVPDGTVAREQVYTSPNVTARWSVLTEKTIGGVNHVAVVRVSHSRITDVRGFELTLTRWIGSKLFDATLCTTSTPYIESWDVYASPLQRLVCNRTYPSWVPNVTHAYVSMAVAPKGPWFPCCGPPWSSPASYRPDIFAWNVPFYQGMSGLDPGVSSYVFEDL